MIFTSRSVVVAPLQLNTALLEHSQQIVVLLAFFIVYVLYVYCMCIVCVLYVYCMCIVCVLFMYCLCSVYVLYMYCICIAYVLYMYCICIVYVLYMYSHAQKLTPSLIIQNNPHTTAENPQHWVRARAHFQYCYRKWNQTCT